MKPLLQSCTLDLPIYAVLRSFYHVISIAFSVDRVLFFSTYVHVANHCSWLVNFVLKYPRHFGRKPADRMYSM